MDVFAKNPLDEVAQRLLAYDEVLEEYFSIQNGDTSDQHQSHEGIVSALSDEIANLSHGVVNALRENHNSFTDSFIQGPRFAGVEIEVSKLSNGDRNAALRVSMTPSAHPATNPE